MSNTISYYTDNAADFFKHSIDRDMYHIYARIEPLLPKNASILEAGCGVGRDAAYFESRGYHVTAFDASPAMVRLAAERLAHQPRVLTFQEMDYVDQFDAVCAFASLLHVPYAETSLVYEKIAHALKEGGIFYGSYKHGENKMETPGRDFYNMNKEMLKSYLGALFEIIDIWTTTDRESRFVTSADRNWINFLARKV